MVWGEQREQSAWGMHIWGLVSLLAGDGAEGCVPCSRDAPVQTAHTLGGLAVSHRLCLAGIAAVTAGGFFSVLCDHSL